MKQYENRKYTVSAIIIVVAVVFIVKLFFIQVLDTKYKVSAENNSQRHMTEYPARGLIYDRNGELMVYNQAAYDLMLIPREMAAFDTLDLCNILEISKQELKGSIKKAKQYSWYKPSIFLKQLSGITYAVLQEKLFKFPGFFVQTRTLRYYPNHVAANVLGYVGEVDERLTAKDSYYKGGDYTGISGIEKTYEKQLRGKKGVTIYLVDVHNRIKGSLQNGRYDTLAVSGSDITTTIDAQLQAYGEMLMQNKIGSIVAIEPATGEILSMVTSPTYDPNLLVGRIRSQNYRLLSRDSLKPLFNRALMAQYPPGSTFKMITGLVGLQEGVLTKSTKYSCSGPSSVPLKCSHNHISPIGLYGSIEQSCNSYYWKVFKSIIEKPDFASAKEGVKVWHDHVVSFGFGKRIGYDLFNELRGNIPSDEYYSKLYKGWDDWKAITVKSLSIGQGEILATPLQLANQSATIANRGFYYKPHLVKKIGDEEALGALAEKNMTTIDSVYFPLMVEAMAQVFEGEHGTARWYKLDSIPMCGKTGTAENPHGDDHSIFIAFAPKDNPKIAISVVVENSGFGTTWAVPIASLMIEKYLTGTIQKKRKHIEDRMVKGNLIKKD